MSAAAAWGSSSGTRTWSPRPTSASRMSSGAAPRARTPPGPRRRWSTTARRPGCTSRGGNGPGCAAHSMLWGTASWRSGTTPRPCRICSRLCGTWAVPAARCWTAGAACSTRPSWPRPGPGWSSASCVRPWRTGTGIPSPKRRRRCTPPRAWGCPPRPRPAPPRPAPRHRGGARYRWCRTRRRGRGRTSTRGCRRSRWRSGRSPPWPPATTGGAWPCATTWRWG
mmetsp:Transcript_45249/g.76251  ORF Transcript_45249/g.76251 Transcript_45249/m.76251 type:complete len:224 (-) Transcript_45249:347-1018(-)